MDGNSSSLRTNDREELALWSHPVIGPRLTLARSLDPDIYVPPEDVAAVLSYPAEEAVRLPDGVDGDSQWVWQDTLLSAYMIMREEAGTSLARLHPGGMRPLPIILAQAGERRHQSQVLSAANTNATTNASAATSSSGSHPAREASTVQLPARNELPELSAPTFPQAWSGIDVAGIAAAAVDAVARDRANQFKSHNASTTATNPNSSTAASAPNPAGEHSATQQWAQEQAQANDIYSEYTIDTANLDQYRYDAESTQSVPNVLQATNDAMAASSGSAVVESGTQSSARDKGKSNVRTQALTQNGSSQAVPANESAQVQFGGGNDGSADGDPFAGDANSSHPQNEAFEQVTADPADDDGDSLADAPGEEEADGPGEEDEEEFPSPTPARQRTRERPSTPRRGRTSRSAPTSRPTGSGTRFLPNGRSPRYDAFVRNRIRQLLDDTAWQSTPAQQHIVNRLRPAGGIGGAAAGVGGPRDTRPPPGHHVETLERLRTMGSNFIPLPRSTQQRVRARGRRVQNVNQGRSQGAEAEQDGDAGRQRGSIDEDEDEDADAPGEF